jgi:hypothetical protein
LQSRFRYDGLLCLGNILGGRTNSVMKIQDR